jgi:phosphoribosyl-ATP pyrophosphohydrolase/phosphoribosyl-AMP cyclohydrolase
MNNSSLAFLAELEAIVQERRLSASPDSYTARLVASGEKRVAQKVGEEAVELALACVAGGREEQIDEAADLLFHLIVLLNSKDIHLRAVVDRLRKRHELK